MREMIRWKIGCSGFYYKSWKETFYPSTLPQREWFDYYCQHFDTVELNVTFYRFPKLSFLQNWYKKSPDHFRFTVKAPRLITHYKKFSDSSTLLTEFYNVVQQGLQEKLQFILFQLPPSVTYSPQMLALIIRSLDTNFLNVLEFRHPSWWNTDVYTTLGASNIIFCSMSHPSLPSDVIVNTSWIYYRMHGDTKLYGSDYSERQLKKLATDIEANGQVKEAYIYFNNDMEGHAVQNAKALKQITSTR
ncbi:MULTISPECIES: DUF72 domain-containing protein [Sphingobacterium]|uniref:DUF72 domain-containing protein n=1 Tax=Sphingobacterium TaxID=28453 RepID=UPI001F0975A9|nr:MULTISPECIES: DUF72 domain-containing protein [unclassified Sphingobacterium]